MRRFLASPSGRIHTATTAFAAFSATLIGLAGPHPPLAAIPLVTLLCIVASILSVGLAIDEFPGGTMTLIGVLGLEAAAFFPLLHVIGGAGPLAIATLVALGLAAAALSVAGGRLARRPARVAHGSAPLGSHE
jgi:hypothetical protein